MPKCFQCDAEIKVLDAYSEVCQTYTLDKKGNPEFYGRDHLDGFTSFNCPECSEELFTDEKEAIKFLDQK